MTALIKIITRKWGVMGIIEKSDEDIYEYGLDLLFYTILNIAVVLGSAAFIGRMAESLAYLSVILPLQSFGGGYHAKTHLQCFLIMYIGWWGIVFILPFVTDTAAILMVCAALVTICKLAPIPHENVRMSAGRRLQRN